MLKTNTHFIYQCKYQRKFRQTFLTLALLSSVIFFLGLLSGTIPLSCNQLFHAFLLKDHDTSYILTLRFERELMAACCGGMLALGSAILQGLTRNSMVAPDLIGMTSLGCLLIIACDIFFFPSPILHELFGIAGAMLGFLLCFSFTKNNHHPLTILLIGISICFTTQAAIQLLVLKAPENMDANLHFLTGSLYAVSGITVSIVSFIALVVVPLTLALSTRFAVFSLDDATCRSIGVPLNRYRMVSFLLAALLIGSSIVGIGNLGFLGIVAPNMARLLVGDRPRYVFPLSFVIGGLIYLFADMIGRCVISPAEIPAGMVTNLISAPLFLYVLFRYYRGSQHEWN